eukprot:403373691
MKLENWGDLFKYSKELLDDDFNHGQQLVLKTKNKGADNTSELSTTTKLSNAEKLTGDSKVAFEAKLKGLVKTSNVELSVKQDGTSVIDYKSNLDRQLKGAQFLFNGAVSAVPTHNEPVLKSGVEVNNSNLKLKVLANLKTLLIEKNLTYLARPNLVVGYNLILDAKSQNLEKYDFGLSWAVANNAFVGLKHDSTSKDQLKLGKVLFYLHHNVSLIHTVGTEYTLDFQKKVVEFRLGYAQKFNDETSGKIKVNHNAYVDLALKHRLNNVLTVGVVTGFNLKRMITEHKSSALPLGFSLDFKF